MNETLKTIIINLVSSAIASGIGWIYQHRKREEYRTNTSKKYIISVKREFYIGFFCGIVLILLPEPNIDFLRIAKTVLTICSFVLCLFGFMCLSDVIKAYDETNKERTNCTQQELNKK